ncbi:YhdP family protein [Acidovorax sp. SRB_24]|uniref:YhdP family protein n=1 Tax=Acidovorax sp. SRB_24 TaxID=1962700 RepID=UPI00145CBFC0|nr:YhdP family protein [Acidovorax sp. SRB_24]NMM77195.1 TIGR02099 family protein [Acidovorax sp. SRB_24]
MNEAPIHPTRLLKSAAWLARWSLGLLLALALVLAIGWGALHGWIVPRIGEFRVPLETLAARALGVPVRIGSISARSEGLIPAVELGDVALLDAQGRAALRLPRVVLAVSPRSLWRLGFEQLYIESPELDVRRTGDGRIVVAGLPFSPAAPGDTSAADWLFAQTEVVVRGGTLRWTDELRGAPPLALGQMDLLLRNRGWRHSLRIDATPPPEWGERFTVSGQFRQPLLSTRSGDWQRWSGQLFGSFARVDLSRLRAHADLGIALERGHGALRAWVDVERGQPVGGVADVALADVSATLGAHLQPLALPSVHGRLGGHRLLGGFEFFTQGLQFVTDDGLRWPGGNLRLQVTGQGQGQPERERGEFHADRLDLAALARIAARLPLTEAVHGLLQGYAPRGLVETVEAHWRGPWDAPQGYQLRGRVAGLALADALVPAGQGMPAPALGLRGATVDVDLTQSAGKATVVVADGALVLPHVFEDPLLPLDHLRSEVRWQVDGERIAVQVGDTRFGNADAQGELRATWHTSDPARSGSRSRFPGVLDLTGTLDRANGARVHRYLPLEIPADARHYVRDAVVAGTASAVRFRVKGDLHDMPFDNPRQGEFRIAARVKDVTYAFVPRSLQTAGELPWPALTQLGGELVFERSSMRVNGASGAFSGTRQTQLSKVQAHIPDLSHTVVSVGADARGPLAELLGVLSGSPLGAMTGHALDQARGSGNAQLRLDLSLPIDALHTAKVRGSVTLAGNDVRITPDTPLLARARGAVQFTESGFALQGVQARALGGDVRLEGGMRALPAGAPASESALQLRAQGLATAEGLQQASELGLVAQLAHKASGSTPYTVALAMRRGVPELQVATTLQGLALALPAPLAKSADSALPVRFETQLTREALATAAPPAKAAPLHDLFTLDLGRLGSVQYVRDLSGPQPQVLRGAIAMGLPPGETAPLPPRGVVANLQLERVDVDAWEAVLLPKAAAAAPAAEAAAAAHSDYLPTQLALRARELAFQGRSLHAVTVGGSREGTVWRANLDATELDGYLEYRQAGTPDSPAGRLFARLSRLTVPQSAASQVDALLEEPPGSLPALDIVVDDFELRGRKWGRLEIEALNRGGVGAQREWRLSKFNMDTPEATLTASGSWALLHAALPAPGAARTPQRRTLLDFQLDIRDSGELLRRFGMADVVRRGKGRLQGQVAWQGAPLSLDYPSMTGQVHLDVEAGQFLKADPGLAKLLGVLSLQSLPRRLTLDFRDVFSDGFAFDFVRGDVRIDHGVATTNNLQMKGVNAAVLMEGRADIAHETQDLHVVVVPEINAMTASLVATAINPVIGLGSFLAQVFLRGPLIAAATQEFRIDGTWADPRVQRLPRRGRSDNAGAAAPPEPAAAAPVRTPHPPGDPS